MDSPDTLAVEIGPRVTSNIESLRLDLFNWKTDRAVLLEKDPIWLEGLSKHYKDTNLIPVIADGSRMPLRDESTKLIFSKDLFSSRELNTLRPDGSFSGQFFDINISSIASESYRVASQGGKVVVLETAIPINQDSNKLADEIEKSYIAAGFELEEKYKGYEVNKIFDEGLEAATGEDNIAFVFKKRADVDKSKEDESGQRRIAVDIGAGTNNSLIFLNPEFIDVNRDTMYLIERNPERAEDLSRLTYHENEIPITADFRNIDDSTISPGSVDLLLAKDVFGSTGQRYIIKRGLTDKDTIDPEAILEKAYILLKTGGRLIILETVTPENSNPEAIEQISKLLGFEIKKLDYSEIDKILHPGINIKNTFDRRSYVLILTKK